MTAETKYYSISPFAAKIINSAIKSDVGSVVSMLVTETTSFQGPRVLFPVKSLGFFFELCFSGKSAKTPTALRRVFPRDFPCLSGTKTWATKKHSGREIGKIDEVGRPIRC